MTKFLNISTDTTLGGDSPSDEIVSSQKAIKTALNAKANTADLATVATSGSYNDLSDKPTIPTVGNGTITITQGGINKGTFTTNQSGDTTIALDADGGGSGLNVGDIFLTMRNDNELNGAVECDGATYNTTDFTGAQSIGQLLTDGKVPYVSMATYATEISTKGWCDKFGWDGTGTTAFRVPTLNAYIWQKLQAIIKGSVGTSSVSDNGRYFVAQTTTFGQQTNPGAGAYTVNVSNDQTIPGASADATNIVSDQRVMVQLATSATDEALETCTSVLADVANLKDHRVIAFQAQTAQNNYTWYRKYADGWVEQGGKFSGNLSIAKTLPITMANTNYQCSACCELKSGHNWDGNPISMYANTTTQVLIRAYGDYADVSGWWQVSGMAAN